MSVSRNELAECPICSQDDHSTFLLHKDGYDLYKCVECHHIFVWPIPDAEVMKHLHSFANSYQVQKPTIYDENTTVSKKAREGLKPIEKFCRRGRLLDVGCSSGKFLWLALRNGWSVCGVELNGDTAQIAIDNGLDVFVGELAGADYPPASFDAIHLGDVIEHVRDPEGFLSVASELLKPEGVIEVVTPNHDAIFPVLTFWLHRFLSIPWSHPTPPYHLNQFSEKSLEKLMRKSNLMAVHKEFRPCSLHYELGETHVLRSVRGALHERRLTLAAGRFLVALITTAAYAIVYAIDRCCVWKRKDFEMLFVVRKRLPGGEPLA